MVGITNATITNITTITEIGNSSTIQEFFVRGNQIMYGGYFFFIMLWVMFIILFVSMQKRKDQPLNNILYSASLCSLIGFMLRSIRFTLDGTSYGLINSYQLFIFPLISIIIVIILWATKEG